MSDNTSYVHFCSFCGKSVKEFGFLIVGPMVSICNECVELSAEIIKEQKEIEAAKKVAKEPV